MTPKTGKTKADEIAGIVREGANPHEVVADLLAAAGRAYNDYRASSLTQSANPTLGTNPAHTIDHARHVARMYDLWADAVAAALDPEVWSS